MSTSLSDKSFHSERGRSDDTASPREQLLGTVIVMLLLLLAILLQALH